MHMIGVPHTIYSEGAVAGLINPAWKKIAWIRALQFLSMKKRGTFMAADLIDWCEANDLPAPPSRTCYGFIFRMAKARKLIRDSSADSKRVSFGRKLPVYEVIG